MPTYVVRFLDEVSPYSPGDIASWTEKDRDIVNRLLGRKAVVLIDTLPDKDPAVPVADGTDGAESKADGAEESGGSGRRRKLRKGEASASADGSESGGKGPDAGADAGSETSTEGAESKADGAETSNEGGENQ